MATNKTTRIATVKATGARYIVQSLDFKSDLAFCWGEVVWVQGTRTKHEESKRFPLAEVEIATVERTPALCVELFEQAVAGRQAAGHVLARSGRKHINITDFGTPDQIRGRIECSERFVRDLPAEVKAIALELGMDLDSELTAADRAALASLAK
ncbi:MAG: hypothetical protein AB7W59_00405 [Acidimicrobiia bacterium]